MKGYSFDGLVKLAEAAMPRAGGEFTGNITAPKLLLSTAQGAEANSAVRRDFLESQLTAGAYKTVTIPTPPGVSAGSWYPVVLSGNSVVANDVQVATRSSQGTDPMNSCSFSGIATAGGNTDRGAGAAGLFRQWSAAERAIHSIWGCVSVTAAAVAFYVEGQAFPVAVRVPQSVDVECTGASIAVGGAIFNAGATPGGTNVAQIINFDNGPGWYTSATINGTSAVMDGNISVQSTFLEGAQSTAANAATRRDFVQGLVDLKLNLAGGTLTGPVTGTKFVGTTAESFKLDVAAGSSAICLGVVGGVHNWYVGKGGPEDDIYLSSYIHGTNIRLSSDKMVSNKPIYEAGNRVYSPANVPSLPVLGAAAVDHIHSGTIISPTWLGTTGGPNSQTTEGVYFQNQNVYATIAKGYPEALAGALINHYIGTGLLVQEYHVYATSRVWRRAINVGTISDWHMVYSTGNPPSAADVGAAPTAHTHTAAQGNADVVASGWGQIGTYAFAMVSTGSTPPTHDLTIGETIAGSSLRPSAVDTDPDDIQLTALPGTWKCMGRSHFGNGETDWSAAKTLFMRIA